MQIENKLSGDGNQPHWQRLGKAAQALYTYYYIHNKHVYIYKYGNYI